MENGQNTQNPCRDDAPPTRRPYVGNTTHTSFIIHEKKGNRNVKIVNNFENIGFPCFCSVRDSNRSMSSHVYSQVEVSGSDSPTKVALFQHVNRYK